ncbi:MAG: hypothetical protein GY856_18700, partial [bacterium]|nr:hypothetical protein [bacterium]
VRAFPAHLSGFLLALGFTSRVAELAVELLGRAFSELPDSLLMPWLPGLLDSLRPSAGDVLPALLKEASRSLPPSLAELDAWTAPWEAEKDTETETEAAAPAVVELGAAEAAARLLLFAHREAAEAAARTLDPGAEPAWSGPLPAAAPVAVPVSSVSEEEEAVRRLLASYPETLAALGDLASIRR